MKTILGFFLAAFVLAPMSAHAQTPASSPAPTPPVTVQPANDDNVVRVTTNLIQIDVVVTDSRGTPITNLKPEDFEVLVNGKPQTITNFSLVTLDPQPPERPKSGDNKPVRNMIPGPSRPLRPHQVQRTIALIVDDISISCKNLPYVRRALRKFAYEQMQPGDLVAIVRVGSSIGALQQFTSNKEQISAAIDRVQVNTTINKCFTEEGSVKYIEELYPALKEEDRSIKGDEGARELSAYLLATPALTATNFVARGMRELPGRKAVMLFSDGFGLENRAIRESIQRLVDTANRSGVVIYTLDARALVAEGLTAADLITPRMTSQQISGAMFTATRQFSAKQDGLIYLAEQAGGFSIRNTNDISGGIRKALDDQKSYYLIGYQPDASLFNPAASRFNQLKVKVKGAGLKVRYRSGFFGVKDDELRPPTNTPARKILQELTSPFASDGISLRLTPLFANDPRAGSFMRTLVHVPAKELIFSDKPGGLREAVINIAAYTFGDNGAVVDSVGEIHTITLTDKLYNRALSSGFVYSLQLPIKKSGPYQLRVAVRDDKSDKVGTASQFIIVPDIKRGRLTLSGIALSSYSLQEQANKTDNQSTGGVAGTDVLTQAALRRFRSGNVLQFAYTIYNAVTKDSLPPRLTTQIKLYRDGMEIFAGKQTPYEAGTQADSKRLPVEGSLQLGGLGEGEYVLQTIVTDALAKEKHRTTTGWIDFEIVK